MSKSALFLHLREQVRDAQLVSDCDQIIETAFSEYMKDNLSYEEYGKIYFLPSEKLISSSVDGPVLYVNGGLV